MTFSRTARILLLFAITGIGIYLIQCAGEKQKTEPAAQQTQPQTTPEPVAVQETAQEVPPASKEKEAAPEPAEKSTAAQEKSGIKVTFVELGSVNCIPCKMMKPILEAIEKEYGDQVKVVFHDVWTPAGRPYAEKYGIRGIPTQVFLDAGGNEFHRHTGFLPKEEVVKVLQQKGVK